jgi:hypothetical protein
VRFAIAFIVMLFAGSCATASLNIEEPTGITSEKTSRIKKNVTTRDELNAMFGEPEMKIPFPEGAAYFYKDISLHSIWVRFNEDWTVTDFEISQ